MKAVLFIGIQGAGKSTFYRERFFDSHLPINLDMLRTRHRERRFLQACVETGQTFVVDNTNPTRADRAVYIQAAKGACFDLDRPRSASGNLAGAAGLRSRLASSPSRVSSVQRQVKIGIDETEPS